MKTPKPKPDAATPPSLDELVAQKNTYLAALAYLDDAIAKARAQPRRSVESAEGVSFAEWQQSQAQFVAAERDWRRLEGRAFLALVMMAKAEAERKKSKSDGYG